MRIEILTDDCDSEEDDSKTPTDSTTTSVCGDDEDFVECKNVINPCTDYCHIDRDSQMTIGSMECFEECIPGCVNSQKLNNFNPINLCSNGKVFSKSSNQCVAPIDCSCKIDGKIVLPGMEVVINDMKTCHCLNNEVFCETVTTTGAIIITGSPEDEVSPSSTPDVIKGVF